VPSLEVAELLLLYLSLLFLSSRLLLSFSLCPSSPRLAFPPFTFQLFNTMGSESESKNQANASDFEVDSQDLHLQSRLKMVRRLDSARVGLTLVALLAGITILGVSADALAEYNATHLPGDFLLPLWPDQFDLRPTVALVVGSTIVTVTNIASLLFSKVRFVSLPSRAQVMLASAPTFRGST
jgi:hypothetical protein